MYFVTAFCFGVYDKLRRLFCSGIVIGVENIPAQGPFIVVANHASSMDPWRVSSVFLPHKINWWTKKELCFFKYGYHDLRQKNCPPIMSALKTFLTVMVVKNCSPIPVDRKSICKPMNRAAYKDSSTILRNGGIVGIFGTGSRYSSTAKPVFVQLALKNKVPLVLVYVSAEKVVISKPESVENFMQPEVDVSRVAEFVMERIVSLV